MFNLVLTIIQYKGRKAMEARASSPRAARSCVNRGKESKKKEERMGAAERKQPPRSFWETAATKFCWTLKSACAPVTARAPLLIVCSAGSRQRSRAVVIPAIVVAVAVIIYHGLIFRPNRQCPKCQAAALCCSLPREPHAKP